MDDNKKDYKLYRKIKFDKRDILFTKNDTNLRIVNDGKFKYKSKDNINEYVSIYERNLNFSIIPKDSIKLKEQTYFIEFLGNKDSSISVELWCIEYSSDKRNKSKVIPIGESKIITTQEGSEYLRLLIRLEGEGDFFIDEINIYEYIEYDINSYEDIMKYKLNTHEKLEDLKIACIFDPLSRICFDGLCTLIDISSQSWKQEFLINRPDIFIVESVWSGYNELWKYTISSGDRSRLTKLIEIIDWCKKENIPTVFWNKEDPTNFAQFSNTAKYFDYIFTTDEGSINNYKDIVNHENVYVLPFAAQPKIHNPIRIFKNKYEKACFAGSYYKVKYPERCLDLDKILDAAINTIGVEIYDRNYNLRLSQYKYPDKYRQFIKGSLPPDNLDITNKGYKVTINVNSVKYSKTMFSRRVYESIASGTPVISSYSKGIELVFKDLVFMSEDINEIENEFIKLSQNQKYYDKKSIEGIRYVLNNHTYEKRLRYILEKVGMKIPYTPSKLSIISRVNNKDEIKRVIKMFNEQRFDNKELILIIENKELLKYEAESDVSYILYDSNSKVKLINEIMKSDYIGIINPNNFYGQHYFEDLINATLYTEAEFIGKASYFKRIYDKVQKIGEDNCFNYVDNIDLDKCIFKYDVVKYYSIEDVLKKIKENNMDMFRCGFRYFSIDNYNFIEKYYSYAYKNNENLKVENYEF